MAPDTRTTLPEEERNLLGLEPDLRSAICHASGDHHESTDATRPNILLHRR